MHVLLMLEDMSFKEAQQLVKTLSKGKWLFLDYQRDFDSEPIEFPLSKTTLPESWDERYWTLHNVNNIDIAFPPTLNRYAVHDTVTQKKSVISSRHFGLTFAQFYQATPF